MKGTTKFIDNNGDVLAKHIQPIDLNKNDMINLESAPQGKPVLTLYRVENKVIKIDMSGWVHYEYTLYLITGPHEQKYFI